MQADLGHISKFLQDHQTDEFACFAEIIYVQTPQTLNEKLYIPEFLLTDTVGGGDSLNALALDTAARQLSTSDVVIHCTGNEGYAQSDADSALLAPLWKVSNSTWSLEMDLGQTKRLHRTAQPKLLFRILLSLHPSVILTDNEP